MFRLLFFVFVVVPIIEIVLLMQVGSLIGAWPTIALVITTAWFGAKNVKQQGISTLQSLQVKMAQGEMPSDDIVAAVCLLVAGILLITPGFVTDILGLSLLVPQFRILLKGAVQQHVSKTSAAAHYGVDINNPSYKEQSQQQRPFQTSDRDFPAHHHQGQTLDGEFERKE